MEYTITRKQKITSEQIDDIMSAALQGIAYWADDASILWKYVPKDVHIQYTSEAISKGVKLHIHDMDEEKWYSLTLKGFLKGMSMLQNFDLEDYDMYDADRVIQYALFGEVRYA